MAAIIQQQERDGFDFIAWINRHILSWKSFFWIANLIFMAVSMQHAGYFFDLFESSQDSALFQGLSHVMGLALAGILDLAVIVFMQAMIVAKERGESSRSRRILLYIAICSGISTVGNLVHNLHFQNTAGMSGVAPWFAGVLPFIASAPPLLIIAFSLVAELLINVNPLEMEDVEEFERQEQKKLAFLDVRLHIREEMAKRENRRLEIEAVEKRNKRLRAGKDSDEPQPQENHQLVDRLEEAKVSPSVDNEVVFPPVEDETDDDIVLSTDTPLIDDITAYLLRQEKDTGDIVAVSTDHETEPRAKVTRKLSTKTSTAKGRENARTKALRIARKHPGIGPTELAQKANITRQYASKILSELSA